MMRIYNWALVATTMALGTVGCGVEKLDDEGETGGGSAVPPAVQQRLTQSCAIEGAGCHTAGAQSPDLSAGSQGAWIDQPGAGGPLVTFGDIGNSYLITKMLPNPPNGGQMPFPPGELSPEDLSIIIGWVAGVEFPNETTGSDPTGDPTGDPTEDPTADPTGDESTGADGPTLCSLSMIDPSATNPIDAGDEAGKIPSSIGDALERNCGCHYTNNVSSPYVPFSGGTQLQTLENFTNDYAGANSAYAGMPAWQAIEDRVITQANMPMALCETEEGIPMTEADFALFEAWFEQEVPDGAGFTPPT